MYPRETLRILESLNLDNETADKIFFKNLERVTDRTLKSCYTGLSDCQNNGSMTCATASDWKSPVKPLPLSKLGYVVRNSALIVSNGTSAKVPRSLRYSMCRRPT